jgi:hypothetical protein
MQPTQPNFIKSSETTQKAMILSWRHPFDAMEMMARGLANGLSAVGYLPSIVDITSKESLRSFGSLRDPDLSLIICLGSPPLNLGVNGRPLWQEIGSQTTFVVIVCDTLPYDFRYRNFTKYLGDCVSNEQLNLISYEKNNCTVLSDCIQKEVRFYQNPASELRLSKVARVEGLVGDEHTRLLFWGSADAELSKLEKESSVESTLHLVNSWGLSARRIFDLSEFLTSSECDFYVPGAISGALGSKLSDLLKEGYAEQISSVDSAVKRFRRRFLVEALEGFPVDIFGKNWEQHLPGDTTIRIKTPYPDQNVILAKYMPFYRGVVNIDPNWSYGTNERAALAVATGVPLVTNHNSVILENPAVFPYRLARGSIMNAVSDLYSGPRRFQHDTTHTWEGLVRSAFN